MLVVSVTVDNDACESLMTRLRDVQDRMADEMLSPNANDPKVRSATAMHIFATTARGQIKGHVARVAELEKGHRRGK